MCLTKATIILTFIEQYFCPVTLDIISTYIESFVTSAAVADKKGLFSKPSFQRLQLVYN